MILSSFSSVFSSKVKRLSSKLQDIETGNHDDFWCDWYCRRYKDRFGQKLPDCQYKGNKAEIQKLIKKVHVDVKGNVTEILRRRFQN